MILGKSAEIGSPPKTCGDLRFATRGKWGISGYNGGADALYAEVRKSIEKYGKVKKRMKKLEKVGGVNEK